MTAGTPRPLHDDRDSPEHRAEPRRVSADHEIAALGLAAGDQIVQGDIDGIKMIDERLARMRVVDKTVVEAWLFETGSLDRWARPPCAVSARPGRGRRGGEDLGVVGLGAAIQRGQKVGRVFPHVQLVKVAPLRRAHPGDSRSFSRRTSWRASRLKSPTSIRTRGPVRPSASSSALWAAIRLW